jgi:Ca2+-binding EF-hand superfamily protein
MYGSALKPEEGGGAGSGDGDGGLSRTSTRGTEAVMRSIFNHFDRDKSGKITQDEMNQLIKVIYELQLACSNDPWYQADRPAVLMSAETKVRTKEENASLLFVFLRHPFILKVITLPRQVRDKRRCKALKKRDAFCSQWRVEARLIFERADTDGSGAVDFQEFVHAAHGMPGRTDLIEPRLCYGCYQMSRDCFLSPAK